MRKLMILLVFAAGCGHGNSEDDDAPQIPNYAQVKGVEGVGKVRLWKYYKLCKEEILLVDSLLSRRCNDLEIHEGAWVLHWKDGDPVREFHASFTEDHVAGKGRARKHRVF